MAIKKQGELRIRKGESIYGPMTRGDLEALLGSRRFVVSDLLSVGGGPWMEIHQYLAQPAPMATLRVLRGEHVFGSLTFDALAWLHDEGRIAGDDLVCAVGGPWMPVADFLSPPAPPPDHPPPVPPARPVEENDFEEPEAVEEEDDLPLTWYGIYSGDLEKPLSDQWYVRVRGIHSAPLTRRQVWQLVLAKEITPHNVARHCTWPEDYWLPIHQIPQLDVR